MLNNKNWGSHTVPALPQLWSDLFVNFTASRVHPDNPVESWYE